MTCAHAEADLDAYLDGELPEERASAIRAHLPTCSECRERVDARRSLSRMLATAPYYTAPESLRTRVAARTRRSPRMSGFVVWAAAAALVLSAAAGVAVIRWPARTDPIVDEAVDAHVRSLMADHLFDVESTDQHTVKPWFLGRLDFSPPVVDLATAGYPLVGGRLDYLDGRPVAALVYQRRRHTINLFVSPVADEDGAATSRTVRGFHVRRWSQDAMTFRAVSDLNDAELDAFVRLLQGT